MDDEIDLRDIFRILWKRRLMIIGIFVVAVMIAGVISFAMPPVYSVSSIIAAGNYDDSAFTSQASMQSIISSDGFLLDVFEEISPDGTPSEFRTFKGGVKVEPVKDNDRLIKISVETKERNHGLMAVETMIRHYSFLSESSFNKHKKVLYDQLADTDQRISIINTEINQSRDALQNLSQSSDSFAAQSEMRFSRTLDIINGKVSQRTALMDRKIDLQRQLTLLIDLEIVQPPREPVSPIWPRKALIIAIAGVLGLMVGVFAAFLREGLEEGAVVSG
jgi:capsular polysaccharide biosynthesis protein